MTARRSVPCWSKLPDRSRRLPAMERTIGTMSTVRSASRMRRSLCRPVRARAKCRGRDRADQRDRDLQLIAERGRMGWQRASGYNWRALMEADIGRYKRVIGDAAALAHRRAADHRGGHCRHLAQPQARAWAARVRSPLIRLKQALPRGVVMDGKPAFATRATGPAPAR